MKKTLALVGLVLFVSAMSVGCTISSPSEWCKRGSLWPFNRNENAVATSESFIVPQATPIYMNTSMPGCCVPSASMDPCAGQSSFGYGTVTPSAGNDSPY